MRVQSDDQALRNAAIANILIESLCAVASAFIFYKQVGGGDDDILAPVTRKLKALRVKYFGPPPLTEEEIANQNRLLQIEAARILREAQ